MRASYMLMAVLLPLISQCDSVSVEVPKTSEVAIEEIKANQEKITYKDAEGKDATILARMPLAVACEDAIEIAKGAPDTLIAWCKPVSKCFVFSKEYLLSRKQGITADSLTFQSDGKTVECTALVANLSAKSEEHYEATSKQHPRDVTDDYQGPGAS